MLKLDLISNIVVLGSGVFGTRTFSVSRQPWSCLVWKNKSFCSSHVLCVSHIAHLHIFICSCVQCVLCVWEYVSQGESVDVRRYLLVLILPHVPRGSQGFHSVEKILVASILAHLTISLVQCHLISLRGKFMWMSRDTTHVLCFFLLNTNELHSVPRRTISKPVTLSEGSHIRYLQSES